MAKAWAAQSKRLYLEIQHEQEVKNQLLSSNSRDCTAVWMHYMDIDKGFRKEVIWNLYQTAESSNEY